MLQEPKLPVLTPLLCRHNAGRPGARVGATIRGALVWVLLGMAALGTLTRLKRLQHQREFANWHKEHTTDNNMQKRIDKEMGDIQYNRDVERVEELKADKRANELKDEGCVFFVFTPSVGF